jgi:hypothetical protein
MRVRRGAVTAIMLIAMVVGILVGTRLYGLFAGG